MGESWATNGTEFPAGESEADRLLRMAVEAMAAEFGHDEMMQEGQPDRIDLAYRAAVAYLGRTRGEQ